MGEPAPLQPDLPFDLSPAASTPVSRPAAESATPPPDEPPITQAWRPALVEELPPPLTQQLLGRLRGLPWSRWRALGRRAIGRGSRIGAIGARILRLGAAAAGSTLAKGAPYAVTLARKTARAGLPQAALRMGAVAVHVVGFPAVVTRTAIQLTAIHRAGLTIETVTYFEVRDPAGYVVYQAPANLGTGVAVAFLPTLILAVLAILCLAPALTPRTILHLHYSLLTWIQIWLGLGFAAHALPTHEEAGPLAEQARTGVGQAEPLALLTVGPAQLVAWVTAFGGLVPAALGIVVIWSLSGALFH